MASIGGLIPEFIKYLGSAGRSDSTLVAYKKDLEQLADYLDDKDVGEINKKDLNNFVKFIIKERELTKKTASRKINSFKTFFKFLIDKKKISQNPADEIDHPDVEQNLPRILSQIEYKAIRDTARGNIRLYTMIEIFLQTGLRIGEVSRLKLEDAKVETNPIKIIINEFQSNSPRIIELNETAALALKTYIESRRDKQNDQGYVFNTRTGRNVLVRNIRTAMNRICKKAGVINVRVNDFRNTFICHQIENEVSLEKTAEYVGHRRLASTEKYLQITQRKTPGTKTQIVAL